MDLTQLLQQKGSINEIANQFGLDARQVEDVINNSLPKISEAINQNTASQEGLKSFWNALNDHQNDDVEGMISDVNNVDTNDGDKILAHIFGEKKDAYVDEISQKQGISASNVGGIMKILAPILMGMLGKQTTNKSKTDSGFGNILDSFLGSGSSVTKMAKSFLDKNNDGNILDDIFGSIFK